MQPRLVYLNILQVPCRISSLKAQRVPRDEVFHPGSASDCHAMSWPSGASAATKEVSGTMLTSLAVETRPRHVLIDVGDLNSCSEFYSTA